MSDGIWIAQVGGAAIGILSGLLIYWAATRRPRHSVLDDGVQWDSGERWGE